MGKTLCKQTLCCVFNYTPIQEWMHKYNNTHACTHTFARTYGKYQNSDSWNCIYHECEIDKHQNQARKRIKSNNNTKKKYWVCRKEQHWPLD